MKRFTLIAGGLQPMAAPGAFRPGNDQATGPRLQLLESVQDLERIRNMQGECIQADANPGLRVEPNFIDEQEEQET